MTGEEGQIHVFVSYSHVDERWLNRLRVHLKPLSRDFDIVCWEDTQLTPGSRWQEKITKAVHECDTAVLLVSADFLASDFIHTNELPPLLQAASRDEKLILPVIVGPCLFAEQEIAMFKAVNDPERSLLTLSEGEAEIVLVDVARAILRRKQIRQLRRPAPTTHERENFLEPRSWLELIKIGDWVPDDAHRRVLGAKMNSYLLSRTEFGRKPYHVDAVFSLTPQPMTGRAAELGMNAGIVLGYNHEGKNPRYVHVTFTGTVIFVEQIGFKGGLVVRDWEHITEPVRYVVEPAKDIRARVDVTPDTVAIEIDGTRLIQATGLTGLVGRVGLRPWRSTLALSKFIVSEAS